MRQLAVLALLASATVTMPAVAKDKQWYAGVDAGVVLNYDSNIVLYNPLIVQGTYERTDLKSGLDVDAVAGYDFGRFRLEGEVAHKRVDLESSHHSVVILVAGQNPYTFDDVDVHNAHLTTWSFMGNALIDIGPQEKLNGFIGAGIGAALIKDSSVLSLGQSSDTVFAWQALAGLRYPLTSSIDLGVKYRYFSSERAQSRYTTWWPLNSQFGTLGVSNSMRTHSIMMGVTFALGDHTKEAKKAKAARGALPPMPAVIVDQTAEPEVVAAPPPPPVITQEPHIVLFNWNKATLTPDAIAQLDIALASYRQHKVTQVRLTGRTDKSGNDAYNQTLSQKRTDAVKAYLVSKGVPDAIISAKTTGESEPVVTTADGVREIKNRSVDVVLVIETPATR